MNALQKPLAPFSRLLWKEYRTQRILWLMIACFALAVQLLMRIGQQHNDNLDSDIWSVSVIAPFLYIIGAAAILFAGERDSCTSDWLLQLATPTGWLLMAKWSFVAVSSLFMGLLLSFAALVLTAQMASYLGVFNAMLFGVGALVWCSLGSLVSRRVVMSIPAMFLFFVATVFIVNIWPSSSADFPDWRWIAAMLIIAIADIVLARWWCQGKYVDVEILESLSTEWSDWRERILRRTEVRTRLPVRAEIEYSWRRLWQRMLWQEWHRESIHTRILYFGCVAGVLMTIVDFQMLMVPMIAFIPMLMGVLAFRSECEGQPIRFLAHRGVSPVCIWLAKQVIWMPRACWIPAVISAAVVASEIVIPPAQGLLRHLGVSPVLKNLAENGQLIELVWFTLLSHGAGQLAAILLRKTVFAMFVGGIMSVMGLFWISLMVTMEVPRWWSVGSLIIWMLGLTLWYSRYWQLEQASRAIGLRLAAAFVIPLMSVIAAVGVWRTLEIPGFGPASTALYAAMHPSDYSRMGSALFDLRRNRVIELKSEFDTQMQPITHSDQQAFDKFATSHGFETERDLFWDVHKENLRQLMEVTQRTRSASFSRIMSLSAAAETSLELKILPQQKLLLEAGRRSTEEGRLFDALDYFCASLRLASFWATDCGDRIATDGQWQQVFIVQHLLSEWANHPHQTHELLWNAVRRLRNEFELFPSARNRLVAEYRSELNRLNDHIQFCFSEPKATPLLECVAKLGRFLPWERSRAHRLLEQQLLCCDHLASVLTLQLNRPGTDVSWMLDSGRETEFESEMNDVKRFQRSTPMVHRPTMNTVSVWQSIIERETFTRESLLALSLLAWKQKNATWPQELGDLLHDTDNLQALPSIATIDPWSGEQFQYQGSRLNQADGAAVESLLLATIGPHRWRAVYVDSLRMGTVDAPRSKLSIRSADGASRAGTHDDRMQLEIVEGRLVLVLPYTKRFPN